MSAGLEGAEKLALRTEKPLPKVQDFWRWRDEQCHRPDLTPTNPLSKALVYARERVEALQVFLSGPAVAIDTNHLERALRPIPMGKNDLFAWTDFGTRHIGITQSLIVACRLQGISPTVYLTDVLQRVSQHPARDVINLTARRWKVLFADNPLRLDLDRPHQCKSQSQRQSKCVLDAGRRHRPSDPLRWPLLSDGCRRHGMYGYAPIDGHPPFDNERSYGRHVRILKHPCTSAQCKTTPQKCRKMVGRVGLEPTTIGLKVRCSTN